MADIARRPDFIDRVRDQHRKVERARIAKPPRNTENFIIDPATPYAFPPVPAPTRATIIGVMCRLGSGGPITVTLNLVRDDPPSDDPNPSVLHTFTDVAGDGTLHIELFPDPIDIELGDVYYPEITTGTGNKFTGSFVISQ